ncbi:hypothetical protein F5148DRAFT_169178 [Russula earlei]|uniref:Uncharacterized protein n=1 Tax=Russula earlei TaxID=71964 RepID=A0ACC0TR63_9AGAM|nr:hypothetical protein F5148DRAFT_169178 [Russula earlei]
MAENSTLDSLTGDSQNFMPLGGRFIVDCGWPQNSFFTWVHHRPHQLAATDRHVPAQPPETTPRRLVSSGLTPSTYLDFLSYACLSFRPFLSLGSSLVYKKHISNTGSDPLVPFFVCARADLTERMHANVVSFVPAGFQVTRMFLQSGILALDWPHCPISQASLHSDTAWPGRGDDAAPFPPTPVSAASGGNDDVTVTAATSTRWP